MNDDNQEIREMLERRALEVKPPSDMPPGLSGRVRRRIALNAVGAGILVIVGLVAFAGIRSLGGGSTVRPIGSPTTSNLPSPTTPAGSTACTSGQLSAAANLGGAAGSRVGSIDLTDTSHDACTVQGEPSIQLLDPSGQPIIRGIRLEN